MTDSPRRLIAYWRSSIAGRDAEEIGIWISEWFAYAALLGFVLAMVLS